MLDFTILITIRRLLVETRVYHYVFVPSLAEQAQKLLLLHWLNVLL